MYFLNSINIEPQNRSIETFSSKEYKGRVAHLKSNHKEEPGRGKEVLTFNS